ncbi:SGT1 protein-domain-containing protein [Geopyxis carbonaria]|nr:SGT1 protein-domain-containing protein [Geopyxis carbonaria]
MAAPDPNDASDPFTIAHAAAHPFQGIPTRILSTDTAQFHIFALSPDLATPGARLAALSPICDTYTSLLTTWTSDHIWQRSSAPTLSPPTHVETHPRVSGTLEYADAIDDEWLLVALLLETTRRHSDAWVRVHDSDGEFLLIEAAHALPRWLSDPAVAANRVWLHGGRVYVIPCAPGQPRRGLGEEEAVAAVAAVRDAESLFRDRMLEKEALQRAQGWPDKVAAGLHWGRVRVPRALAGVLRTHPEAVAAATEAFYVRDPVAMRCLRRPNDTRTDWVDVAVKFTKVLIAQLKGQQWRAPSAAGWPADGEAGAEVGTKLAAGFEMLLAPEHAALLDDSPGRAAAVAQIRAALDTPAPTDAELGPQREGDSEDWLHIDFSEFEKTIGKDGEAAAAGAYGDAAQEEKLKRMVERFEKFLNDDEAGIEGAEMGSDGELNSDDDDSDDDGDGEDVDFDEEEFSRLMREMMGLPPGDVLDSDQPLDAADATEAAEAAEEEAEIRRIQNAVGAELKAAGVLGLGESKLKKEGRITDITHDHSDGDDGEDGEGDSGDDEDAVRIDYNLVKNLLESFKGQDGLAGPGGNILAGMGIVLPRDEPGAGEEEEAEGKGKGKRRAVR